MSVLLSDIIDPDTRVSLILGGFDGSFQTGQALISTA
jgi:hypothetical protein